MALSATSADENGPFGQVSYPDERKNATILFADIVGSTSLVARRDPEVALDLLRPALTVLSEAVQRYAGTVNRVTGDGLMAMFGAPYTEEEHALGACCAALEMHAALIRSGLDIQVRIGIHSGEIVMHEIRLGLVQTLDAAGEAVHLAARLQQDAPAGGIWISEATFALARGRLETRIVGSLDFRGFDSPTIVHLLQAADASLSRLDVAGRRGLSPFVNRQQELGVFEASFARAADGHGCAVALIGEPGVGKSRLIREFVASSGGARVLEARCTRWRDKSGFHPIRVLMRRLLGFGPTDDMDAMHTRLEMALAAPGEPQVEALAAVAALQGIGSLNAESAATWEGLDPNARRRRIIDGCLALLLRAASDKPLIAVIDDIHWADTDTDEVIQHLLDAVDGSRLLLLLGCRSGYQSDWIAHPALTPITMPPLSSESSRTLARQVLGSRAGDDGVVADLADRAGGNPFFIEEAAAMPDLALVPPSVGSLLGARLDRLKPGQKQFIETLATVGEPATADMLSAVLDENSLGTAPALVAAELEAAGLVRIDGVGGSARFACHHSLLQEVAYRGLTRTRSRVLHARIATAMERLARPHAGEEPEVLARHARLGEDWPAAVRHAQAAGARAFSVFANREAVRFYEEAIDALARLPEDAEALSLGVDLRIALREPLFHIGRIAELRTRLDEAASLAEGLGDVQRLGMLYRVQAHHAWLAGDYTATIAAAQRASALAEAQRDAALALVAVFGRGLGEFGKGNLAAAAAAMAQVAAHAEDPEVIERFGLDARLAVIALGFRARALTDLADFDAAEQTVAACSARATELGRPFESIFAAVAKGYLLLARGAAAEAVPQLAEAVALCDRAEADLMRPVAQSFLGAAQVAAGNTTEGLNRLDQATRSAAAMGLMFQQPLRLALLSEALSTVGRGEEAIARSREAVALAVTQGDEASLAVARRVAERVSD